MYTECFLCHQYCDTEKHHIFGGALRKKSEKMQALHEYGQRKTMEEHGWTIEDFIANFYKNYI